MQGEREYWLTEQTIHVNFEDYLETSTPWLFLGWKLINTTNHSLLKPFNHSNFSQRSSSSGKHLKIVNEEEIKRYLCWKWESVEKNVRWYLSIKRKHDRVVLNAGLHSPLNCYLKYICSLSDKWILEVVCQTLACQSVSSSFSHSLG